MTFHCFKCLLLLEPSFPFSQPFLFPTFLFSFPTFFFRLLLDFSICFSESQKLTFKKSLSTKKSLQLFIIYHSSPLILLWQNHQQSFKDFFCNQSTPIGQTQIANQLIPGIELVLLFCIQKNNFDDSVFWFCKYCSQTYFISICFSKKLI